MRKRLAAAATGVLAGMIAGFVAGAGARVAMRMVADGVADGVGVRPDFTIAGTAAILIAGLILGAPLGLAYALVADRLPVPMRLRGIVFGVIALALIGPVLLSTDEFFSQGRVVLFAVLFPLFGVAIGLAVGPSRRIVTRLVGIAHAPA